MAEGTGRIVWVDLTVDDADGLKDFYADVAGWRPEPLDMGGYNDYSMNPPGSDEAAAGVCHARGENVGLPPAWLIYIGVPDVDEALSKATARGGSLIMGPRGEKGQGRFAVVRDPAGAAFGLFETV